MYIRPVWWVHVARQAGLAGSDGHIRKARCVLVCTSGRPGGSVVHVRPPWCVLVGTSGKQSVLVCTSRPAGGFIECIRQARSGLVFASAQR